MGRAVEYLWLALAAYWLISAAKVKDTKQHEGAGASAFRTVVMVVSFALLFWPRASAGWLGERFLPQTEAVAAIGVAVEAIGIALAIWARYCLGANWSRAVTLKEGHELISAGPYKRIRHPIYTGFALGILGTAIFVGEWRGVVAFAVVFIAHYIKARKEEAFLAREFGPAFDAHRAHTGMFLPKLAGR
jgi:protein-S-isoprenylcysteine O-methyltransferase Ste14